MLVSPSRDLNSVGRACSPNRETWRAPGLFANNTSPRSTPLLITYRPPNSPAPETGGTNGLLEFTEVDAHIALITYETSMGSGR